MPTSGRPTSTGRGASASEHANCIADSTVTTRAAPGWSPGCAPKVYGAAAGDDEEVLRRAALIIDLAKAKDAASVEAFGARFFFEQPQPEPPSRTHTQPLQWMMLLQAGR
eukprot:7386644-Prymnesium_polylepis.1